MPNVVKPKPYGEAVTLKWSDFGHANCKKPRVGEFVQTPRFAYLVGVVRDVQRRINDGERRAMITAMRIDPETIPAGVEVRPWAFAPRDPIET